MTEAIQLVLAILQLSATIAVGVLLWALRQALQQPSAPLAVPTPTPTPVIVSVTSTADAVEDAPTPVLPPGPLAMNLAPAVFTAHDKTIIKDFVLVRGPMRLPPPVSRPRGSAPGTHYRLVGRDTAERWLYSQRG